MNYTYEKSCEKLTFHTFFIPMKFARNILMGIWIPMQKNTHEMLTFHEVRPMKLFHGGKTSSSYTNHGYFIEEKTSNTRHHFPPSYAYSL